MDSEEHRLTFILEGQQHCDHFLTPIADPAGKTVLVAGPGAGTEMLWCLRHGAREVVGVDVAPQTAQALSAACAQMHLAPNFTMHQIAIEDAAQLDRRFDLVLSNNVFEHVSDIPRSLAACAQLVAEDGRIAIFTDPLFYSSSGSHLPHRPWEHLWGDVAGMDEIPLNRMRLIDFLEAVRQSGLVLLNLRIVPDRNLRSLPDYRLKLGQIAAADPAPGAAARQQEPAERESDSSGWEVHQEDQPPPSERQQCSPGRRAERQTECLCGALHADGPPQQRPRHRLGD